MARILALDWDQRTVHLVSAQTGRTGVRIDRAVQWQEDFELTPQNAAVAGQRLRERLKEFGFVGGPVLLCTGRERVILKEVRFPAVPPREEPALVRFQASKDLTEAAEDVVIDYQVRGTTAQGDRQAMAVIVRRDMLRAYQTLCRTAGLRLAAIAPRAFGAAGAIERATGVMLTPSPSALDAVLGVLTLGERWAELCIVRGKTILLARSLAMGTGLPGEIKRSLALFAGAHGDNAAQALYVAGNGEHGPLRERLHDMLGLPVHSLDPFAREEEVNVTAKARGGFTGAVGLLHLWSKNENLPINFAKPKEPRPESDPNQRRRVLIAAGVLVAFLALLGIGQWILAEQRDDLRVERDGNASRTLHLKKLEEDSGDVAALKEWDQTTVPWLDELYDLSARMDFRENFRLTRLNMGPAPKRAESNILGKKATGPAYAGLITVTGAVPESQDFLASHFIDNVRQDHHLNVNQGTTKTSSGDAKEKEFNFTVNVLKQPRNDYVEQLLVPTTPSATKTKKRGGR